MKLKIFTASRPLGVWRRPPDPLPDLEAAVNAWLATAPVRVVHTNYQMDHHGAPQHCLLVWYEDAGPGPAPDGASRHSSEGS